MDMVRFTLPKDAPTRTGAKLIDQLLESGYPLIEESGIDAFICQNRLQVLFVTGDPQRLLDSVDIAVVLAELVRHFGGRLAGGVCARNAEAAMAARFGADVRPALVFFAAGQHLGTIPRVRDWGEYVEKIDAFLVRASDILAPNCQ